MKALIYDIEILKAICGRNENKIDGIEYCGGWQDHNNMGISVIGAFDFQAQRPRVFLKDNFAEFKKCVDAGYLMVGFNSIPFDNKVIAAALDIYVPEEQCYDLLREIWKSAGLGPEFVPATHGGFGLDAVCEKNFGTKKSGNGALAPVLWQRGQYGEVIDYCLNDIALTTQLFNRVVQGNAIINPKDGARLYLRVPDLTVPST